MATIYNRSWSGLIYIFLKQNRLILQHTVYKQYFLLYNIQALKKKIHTEK